MAEDIPRGEEVHTAPVGYELDAYDGGLDPFEYSGDHWPPTAPYCPECDSLLDFEYIAREVRLRGSWDFASADGRIILSERAQKYCRQIGAAEQDFRLLDPKRRLFELWPRQILKVDVKRSEPRFVEFCTRCGNFGGYMFYRGLFFDDVPEPLREGFYRTDLMFGQGMGKCPIFVVAPQTMEKLKVARFRRLKFQPVPYANPRFKSLQQTIRRAAEYTRERAQAERSKKSRNH